MEAATAADGNCDVCFDMKDSLLDVLLHDDGARLDLWSSSELGPQQANNKTGILEVAWTRPTHDLESHLPAIFGFLLRHRHTVDMGFMIPPTPSSLWPAPCT